MLEKLAWQHLQGVPSRSYTCGNCGNPLAAERGWLALRSSTSTTDAFIYICHHCTRPTFFDYDGRQVPGSAFGGTVSGILDDSVRLLYEEARRTTTAGSYTATVLCCRKLLMHIAVAKGAEEGKTFVHYVEYLSSKNYVPPDARDWVDHIRAKGNEANHQIVILTREDAEELLSFVEMLLKIIYEFPAAVKSRLAPKAGDGV